MKFRGYGIIEVRKGVRVNVGLDFVKYYKKLIDYYYFKTLKNQLPAHGAHISVVLPDIHGSVDFQKVKDYHGGKTYFEYDPEDVYKSTKNIWMNVDLPVGYIIKNKLGIVEKDFWGFHLTLCNFKFEKNEKVI